MAIYHCRMKPVSRASEHTAVAATAYYNRSRSLGLNFISDTHRCDPRY